MIANGADADRIQRRLQCLSPSIKVEDLPSDTPSADTTSIRTGSIIEKVICVLLTSFGGKA